MSPGKLLILISAICEGVLGIPLVGGFIVMGFSYTPLAAMFILHIVTLIVVARENQSKAGSILGIVTSCIAWVPFLGMFMHWVACIVLFVIFAKYTERPNHPNPPAPY